MSTERLKRNLSILDVLNKTTKNQRKAFIDTATRDQLMCICDCATNILNENIPLTPKQYKELEKYQTLLRYLSDTKNYRRDPEKRKYINQSGGFLPLLLAPILGAAGSILAETLIKK